VQTQTIQAPAAHHALAGLPLGAVGSPGAAILAFATAVARLPRAVLSGVNSGRRSRYGAEDHGLFVRLGVAPLLGDVIVERDDDLGYTYVARR
jgi:hypothetical protein